MNKLIFLLFMLLTHGMVLSQSTVGWGEECDFDMNQNPNQLQLALNSGASEVRLSNQNEYMLSVELEAQMVVKGGYADCQAAFNDDQSNINSIINAENTGLSAMTIKGIENANVLVDSISFINGEDSGLNLIKNDGIITLNHVSVSSNNGQTAGGIYAFNFQTLDSPGLLTVNIKNSVIKQNGSESNGGGITCQGTSGNVAINFNISDGTIVHQNHAGNSGGGIYTIACDMNFMAGENTTQNNADQEVYLNTSNGSGAGIAVQDAEVYLMGSQTMAFDISNNESGSLMDDNTSGGGLFVVGNSEVTLVNAHVVSNKAQRYGAGLYTNVGSTVNMDIAESGCSYSDYCSKIQSNELPNSFAYGAAAAGSGGIMSIKRTLIQFNNSNSFGYIAHGRNEAQLILEGNLILNNGTAPGFNAMNGFHIQDNASLSLLYNTTDGNLVSQVLIDIFDNTNLVLIGNIIDESADILYSTMNVVTNINCNMMSQVNNITANMVDTIIDNAVFLDQSTFGNYRLDESSSNAMDVCSDVIYLPSNDLSNAQRGVDNIDVADFNGLFDLGAYEYNLGWDVIFSNSFE